MFVLESPNLVYKFKTPFRVASVQGKVRENFYFSRSGKSQGILQKVMENLWISESQGKVSEFSDECPQYVFYDRPIPLYS